MYAKLALLASLLAAVEGRFGEEQKAAGAIQALGAFGNPGQAATLAGQSPGVLLAGANACAKLELADLIIEQLGTDPAVIAAAIGLVAAEKNFNPFAQSIPTICSDVNLPASEALRGVIPLVDPAVAGSDVENANSALSINTPFNAVGLSVAQIVIAQGFSNFTLQSSDGATAAADGAAAGGAAAAPPAAATSAAAVLDCAGVATLTKVVKAPKATAAPELDNVVGGVINGIQQSSINGLDFGLCVPTIKFQGGLGGRPATEFTFQAIDPLVALGQQEALNPNIITNRVCDQLTNVCEANDAAKAACEAAQAQIEALGTRDATTADAFNAALGF